MADSANNNTCRTLSDSSKFQQPNSPLSYFFSIRIAQAQPKIRIKIPRMLGKTMQRKSYHFLDSDAEENHKRDAKKRVASRKTFGKKVGLIFCKVFGQKKTAENCSNGKVCSNGDGNSGGLTDGKEAKIWELFGFHDMGSVESRIKSSRNYVNGEEKQSGNAAEEGRKQKRRQQASIAHNKLGQVTFKNFINKKKSEFSFFGGNCRRSNSSANVVVGATDFLMGKVESSPELPMVRSRILTTSQKLKKGEEGEELCKKRILMGGKCRPLNSYGILQYDKDGILLPDNLS